MPETRPTKKEASTFCFLCEWICRCWSMNLAMQERMNQNPVLRGHLARDKFEQGKRLQTPVVRFLEDYLLMSGPYAQLELAKLHDTAGPQEMRNLSIEFFAEGRFWANRRQTIESVVQSLDAFWQKNKLLDIDDEDSRWRNKRLAHHDRKTFLERPNWTIPPDEIDEYLENLGKLAAAIWKNWDLEPENGPRDFDWSVNGSFRRGHQEEADEVIACILAGLRAKE